MAKLYFRYGAMGASKTANMLMTQYNYLERGKKAVILKPKIENRDGKTVIQSRIGLKGECFYVEDFIEEFIKSPYELDCILVDEAQFLSATTVEQLCTFVDVYEIPVICYGLKGDFQTNLFEGSKRLMELADVIEQIPTICWCGKKAHMNARIQDGKIVKEGSQIQMGGNESYISLCRKHYFEENLGILKNKI